MPAAPAPITTMSASRGNDAPRAGPPSAGVIARAADAHRKSRRVIVMSWFPELLKKVEGQENV
jgi:hypothetical protein